MDAKLPPRIPVPLPLRLVADERGSGLFRYAVIIAVACAVCFVAFTTLGHEFAEKVWALGDKIAGAS